jgi:hypothetical protein
MDERGPPPSYRRIGMEGKGTHAMAKLVIVVVFLVREEGDIEFLHKYHIWTGV